MKLGIIGLGRMGTGIAERLLEGGHEVVAWNRHADKVQPLVDKGATRAETIADFKNLPAPRVVWAMVPAGEATEEVIFGENGLASTLEPGDIIIDGGNSHYTDSVAHSKRLLADHNIHLIDIGTSGGLSGRENGYCLMVGGDTGSYEHIKPALESIDQSGGLGHFGPAGAGHYVKMVHNAIEYGMMQSMAEGFDLLMHCEYADLDLHQVADVWQHGSIVESFLIGLCRNVFATNPHLDGIEGYVAENGEARWTVEAAKAHHVTLPSVELALKVRADSQTGTVTDTTRILAALRQEFGGHSIEKPTVTE
jgi:6-phosphogluconate dehydrogenase